MTGYEGDGTGVQEDVLLYGGEGAGDLRPEFVPKLNWLLATDFMPGYTGTVRLSSLPSRHL